MQYQWILDVLGDVRSFAQRNGMKDLARQMDQSLTVAAADISRAGSWPVVLYSKPPQRPTDDVTGGAE